MKNIKLSSINVRWLSVLPRLLIYVVFLILVHIFKISSKLFGSIYEVRPWIPGLRKTKKTLSNILIFNFLYNINGLQIFNYNLQSINNSTHNLSVKCCIKAACKLNIDHKTIYHKIFYKWVHNHLDYIGSPMFCNNQNQVSQWTLV